MKTHTLALSSLDLRGNDLPLFPYQYQKQQTIQRMLSRNNYLKGTSGAAWILCAVMTDQPLASPTGYSQGKIIFKLKS